MMDEFYNGNELIEIRDRIINWHYNDYLNWCKIRKKQPMRYIDFLEIESQEIEKRRGKSDRYMC